MEEKQKENQVEVQEETQEENRVENQEENNVETMDPEEALETMGAAMNTLGGALGNLETVLSGVEKSLNNLYTARRAFHRIGMGAAVLSPATLAVQMAAGMVLSRVMPGWNETWLLWLVSLLPMYLVGTPLAILFMRAVPASPPEEHPLKLREIAALVPVALMLSYAGNAAALLLASIGSYLTGSQAPNVVANLLMRNYTLPLLRAVMLVIISPTLEEYVFRKIILDRIGRYGERLAVLVSALLFALVHGNFIQFCYAFLLGLLFGYVYLRTGRLRYPLGLHILVNFMGSVVGPAVLRYAGEGGGSMVTLGFLALVFLICGSGVAILVENWRRIRFYPAKEELPRGAQLRTAFLNPGMIFAIFTCLWMFVIAQMLS